jgi:hypothetical protein
MIWLYLMEEETALCITKVMLLQKKDFINHTRFNCESTTFAMTFRWMLVL